MNSKEALRGQNEIKVRTGPESPEGESWDFGKGFKMEKSKRSLDPGQTQRDLEV